MNEIRKKIKVILAAVFLMKVEEIPENSAPGIIEKWDSLRHMNLVMALEEEFDIRFPDSQIEELISLDLIELSINELLG